MRGQQYLLRNCELIDGVRPEGQREYSVLVDEHHIAWMGPDAHAPVLGDGIVIDLGGRALLPGLINAHVHLCHDGAPDLFAQAASDPIATAAIRGVLNLERTLMNGITTVRDCGSAHSTALHLAKAVDSGLLRGPRILAAGRVITMTGGHGHFIGTEADGNDAVRRAVRTELKAGAQLIKLMATGGVLTPGVEPGQTTLQVDELSVGVQEAHNAGRKVACHAIGAQGICNALTAGVDTIEHGNYIDDAGIELALKRGAFLVPTFVAPRAAVLGSGDAGNGEVVRKAQALIAVHRERFTAAFGAGVRIAAGTDAGTPFNPHGDIVGELALMLECGVSASQAIQAATRNAASALGIDHKVGSIEVGKEADLIVVGGDPLASVEALRDVWFVMKAGDVYLDRFRTPATGSRNPPPGLEA